MRAVSILRTDTDETVRNSRSTSARCPRLALTVAGVTEVIVRELRLRGYEDVQHAVAARRGIPGDIRDGTPGARDTPPVERLAQRYSRRRVHDVALDL